MVARKIGRGGKPPGVGGLTPRAAAILAYIVANPGSSSAEIADGLEFDDAKYVREVASVGLVSRDLVTAEHAPGRGNSLGAYVLRFYPTAKAKAGDMPASLA